MAGSWLMVAALAAFDVSHYEVRLVVDPKAKTIKGEETILYTGDAPATFSAKGLKIEELERNGHKLRFRFAGTPARGLRFDAASFHTAFFTCDWMVCVEDPGDKATLDLEVRVEGGGKLHTSGKTDTPLPAYLFGFAGGDLLEKRERLARGPEIVVLAEKEFGKDMPRVVEETKAALRFFEEKSGIRYPHRTYTQIVIAGEAAQEGTDFAVVQGPPEPWLIAHELAHQWWGNSVTCRNWSHLWLNEGITTFMVAAYLEHRFGKAEYERELALLKKRHQVAVDAGFDVPLDFAGAYPSLKVRRAIQYSKGALRLADLRAKLGEEKFWRLLKAYTQRFEGGSVETKDFEQAMALP